VTHLLTGYNPEQTLGQNVQNVGGRILSKIGNEYDRQTQETDAANAAPLSQAAPYGGVYGAPSMSANFSALNNQPAGSLFRRRPGQDILSTYGQNSDVIPGGYA
jgi:hypothetical protein